MKAIYCTKYGQPDVLKIVSINKPLPKEHEVLIKISATSVTIADSRVRGFKVPASFWLLARLSLGIFSPRQPILGGELSGVVEAVGSNAQKFKVGDKVFAFSGHKMGAYAEYTCIDENNCVGLKPENLSFEQAAVLSFGGTTALHFLRKGNVTKGEKILIYGASGSVGSYAVQLARYFEAEVTAFCSTANLELVRRLGAHRVVDYTKTNISDLSELFDVVFDTVGKTKVSDAIKVIKPQGRYIHTVTTPFTELKIRFYLLMSTVKLVGGTFKATVEQFDFIKRLAADGIIKPVIDRTYRFDQIVQAHEYVDKGHKKGNVVIQVNGASHEN